MSCDYRLLEWQANRLLWRACPRPDVRRRSEHPWLSEQQLAYRSRVEQTVGTELALAGDEVEELVLARLEVEEARRAADGWCRTARLTLAERLCWLLPLYDLRDGEIGVILGVRREAVVLHRRAAADKIARLDRPCKPDRTGQSTSCCIG